MLHCMRQQSSTQESFACLRSLLTENPKAAVADDAAGVVFIQLTAVRECSMPWRYMIELSRKALIRPHTARE